MNDVEKEISELKKMKRNGLLYGSGLMVLGGAALLGILAIFQPSVDLAPYIFVVCVSISIAGIIYLFYVGDTAKNLLRSVEIIKQIEPDELIVTKKFVLGRKGDIYLLTKRTAYMLSLLKFNDLIETNERKIKVKDSISGITKGNRWYNRLIIVDNAKLNTVKYQAFDGFFSPRYGVKLKAQIFTLNTLEYEIYYR